MTNSHAVTLDLIVESNNRFGPSHEEIVLALTKLLENKDDLCLDYDIEVLSSRIIA